MGCTSTKEAYDMGGGGGTRISRVLTIDRKGSWFSNALKSAAKQSPKAAAPAPAADGNGGVGGDGGANPGGGGSAKVAVAGDS